LKAKQVQNQYALIVDGSFGFDKQEDVAKFMKDAYSTVLAGFNRASVPIQIDCQIKVGDKFKEITEVVDVNTYEAASITHKTG